MRTLLAVALLLSLPAAVRAESLPLRLKDGATWTITASHVRASTGPRAQNWTLNTVKRLVWTAPRDQRGARLTISPVSASVGEGSPPEVARARSLAVPATLEVDQALTPGAIVDVEVVRAAFQTLVGRDIRGSEALADAAAKAMIASEVALAARSQGADLPLGKTLEADGEIENPLGGPPIRVRESYRLDSYDTGSGRAVVLWRQFVDPAVFAKQIVASLSARMRTSSPNLKPSDVEAGLKDTRGTIDGACRHEIDIPSGLAIKVECRTSNSVTVQRETRGVTDTWTITQTLPETS